MEHLGIFRMGKSGKQIVFYIEDFQWLCLITGRISNGFVGRFVGCGLGERNEQGENLMKNPFPDIQKMFRMKLYPLIDHVKINL